MAAAAALVLAGLDLAGRPALVAGVAVLQALVVLGWLGLPSAQGGRGGALVPAAAAAAADVLLVAGHSGSRPATAGVLAGVVGLAVPAALVHQLARRPRHAVTLSLAATLSAVLAVVFLAEPVALRSAVGPVPRGRDAVAVSLAAAAAALLAAAAADGRLHRPGRARAAAVLALGLVAGLAVGAAGGATSDRLGVGDGVLLGLGAAAAAAVAARLLAVASAPVGAMASRWSGPGDAACSRGFTPGLLAGLLPVAAVGPAAYAVGRALLG